MGQLNLEKAADITFLDRRPVLTSPAPLGDCGGRVLPGVGGRGGVSVLGGGDTWMRFEGGDPPAGNARSRPLPLKETLSPGPPCFHPSSLALVCALPNPLNRGQESARKPTPPSRRGRSSPEKGARWSGEEPPRRRELSSGSQISSLAGGLSGGEGAPPRRRAGGRKGSVGSSVWVSSRRVLRDSRR